MQQFTKDDFLSTTEPYEYLYSIKNNPLKHEQALEAIQENARAVGVRGFRKLYQCYVKEVEEFHPRQSTKPRFCQFAQKLRLLLAHKRSKAW